jgi:hypothetical protein
MEVNSPNRGFIVVYGPRRLRPIDKQSRHFASNFPENGVFTNFDPERPSRNLISVQTVEVAEMLVGKLEACDC